MSKSRNVPRRSALTLAAAGAALPHSAGKVSVGVWDHWVPAGNDVMRQVQADFITSNGQKDLLTISAEAQAKTGHDIQQIPGWPESTY
jgi:hypothetical protein